MRLFVFCFRPKKETRELLEQLSKELGLSKAGVARLALSEYFRGARKEGGKDEGER